MSTPASASPSLAEPAEPPDRLFTPAFARLIAVQLFFGLSFSAFFLLPKFVTVKLHGDSNAIGRLTSAATIAGVLAAPLIGRWLDRGRRAPLISIGALATALCALGFAYVSEVGPFAYALRVVQGVAMALVFNAASTLASDLAPPARLGQAFGWFGAAALSMNAVGPALAERIADSRGWSTAFIAAAAAGIVAASLSLGLKEPTAGAERREASAGAEPILPGRFGLLFAMAASGAGFGVMFTFSQPFALELGERRVSDLFLGYAAAAVFVRLALGSVADRFGRLRVALASLTLYGAIVTATAALRPGLLLPIGLVFGVAHGLFYPALSAFAMETVRARRGMLNTLIHTSFNVGVSGMVVFCGWIAKITSYELVFLIAGSFVAGGVVALAKSGLRRSAVVVP